MSARDLDRCPGKHRHRCEYYRGRWWWLWTVRCHCPCHQWKDA